MKKKQQTPITMTEATYRKLRKLISGIWTAPTIFQQDKFKNDALALLTAARKRRNPSVKKVTK